jgi:AcrR family transcriptional regulator
MPKIIDKKLKKESILQAAIVVFAEKGIQKSKMIDIANYAKIGKGTIYEYFDSKESIFIEAYRTHFREMEQQVLAIRASEDRAMEKLKKLTQNILIDFFSGNSDFAGLMMDFWAEGIRNKDEKMLGVINLKGMYSMFREVISSILQQGIDEGVFRSMNKSAVASSIIGSFDGLLLQWAVDHDAIKPKIVAEQWIDVLFHGIKI